MLNTSEPGIAEYTGLSAVTGEPSGDFAMSAQRGWLGSLFNWPSVLTLEKLQFGFCCHRPKGIGVVANPGAPGVPRNLSDRVTPARILTIAFCASSAA